MSLKRTDMECTVIECYPELLKVLEEDADSLEIVCGIHSIGEMRTRFLEAVFGREIRRVTHTLDDRFGEGQWAVYYPGIAEALDHLQGESH